MPPFFRDIGKSAEDLLTRDLATGQVKLEVKTTAPNGTVFKVQGNQDNTTGGITGSLDIEHSNSSKGLKTTESWDTANNVKFDVDLIDSMAKGLTLSLGGALNLNKQARSAKVGAQYKDSNIATKSSLDLFKGPVLAADFVVGRDGLLFGVDTGVDLSKGTTPSKYNFSLGYSVPEYTVALHLLDKTDRLSGSIFHKVSHSVEACAKGSWVRRSDDISFQVGSKYVVDKNLFLKSKIDTQGRLGLSMTQTVRPGVKVNLAALLDTVKIGENAHRLGMTLKFES